MAELPLQSITIGSNKYILSGSGGGSVDSTSEPTEDTVAEFDSDAHMNSTDMTTGSGSELEDFIDGLNVSGGLLGDYVIEQGTSGDTTYRKWNSGVAECWIHTSQSVAISNVYGSLYQGTWRWYFPFIFISAPTVLCAQFKWGTSASWGTVSGVAVDYTDLRAIDVLSRDTTAASVISAYAKGRWK